MFIGGRLCRPCFCQSSIFVAAAVISLATAAHQEVGKLFTTVSDMFPKSVVGAVTGIGGMADLGSFVSLSTGCFS
jgi:ACS family hexuronate transporter-like MFS transporter